jgi:uncharacterized protein YkwD
VRLDLPRGADRYDTRGTPRAAVGGGEAGEIERALVDVAGSRGMRLEGDGRLAELGQFILGVFKAHGRPPTSGSVDACARHLGLVEPVPLYMIFGKEAGATWGSAMQAMLRDAPAGVTYNRYGVAFSTSGQPLAVTVLSRVSTEIQPIARQAEPGDSVVLQGQLREPYRNPSVEVTRPDGSVEHVGDAFGESFRFAVPLLAKGVHRIELLAEGPYGAEVLANFPMFVGVREPSEVSEPVSVEAAADPRDEHAVEARLFALLNEARQQAKVPPLLAHQGLAEVAALHSRDMIESGFFGHESPRFGDPATRVHRKGLAFVLLAENIGRGSTAEEVHSMLLDSPGHRANALDPNLTHVGIGVALDVRQGRAEIIATEDFGGVAKHIDLEAAPDDVIRRINAERVKAGTKPLVVDTLLSAAALSGATSFFRDASLSEQQVVASVNDRLVKPVHGSSPIAKRMRAAQSFLFPLISLDRLPPIDRALDPTARYIGVGVAEGPRPDMGPNAIAVVVVLGWPR